MALDAAASRTQPLASRLHKSRGAMGRFFLSGQTTCALLLGAGLLLRAQSALRSNEPAPRAPRAHPAKEGPEWESAFPREEGVRAQAEANGGGDERRPLRLPACTIASLRLRKPHGFFDPDGVGGGE